MRSFLLYSLLRERERNQLLKMKESCALCKSQARIYCDSDKAMLCWTCDAKVHSANFLVAKHCRCLLCHVCQSPTPWSASGEKLGRTVSVCERCVDACHSHRVRVEDDLLESEGDYDAEDNDEDEDETDDDLDLDVDEDDEEEENQVVPWSSISHPPSPSSSSTRDYRRRLCTSYDLCSKRMPDNIPDLSSDDDCESMSCEAADEDDAASARDTSGNGSTEVDVDLPSARPLKVRKMEAGQVLNVGHRSVTLMESLKRLHEEDISLKRLQEEDINTGSSRICRTFRCRCVSN